MPCLRPNPGLSIAHQVHLQSECAQSQHAPRADDVAARRYPHPHVLVPDDEVERVAAFGPHGDVPARTYPAAAAKQPSVELDPAGQALRC
eukprot:6213907-Pleurochrysis_carterae.AAC.3